MEILIVCLTLFLLALIAAAVILSDRPKVNR